MRERERGGGRGREKKSSEVREGGREIERWKHHGHPLHTHPPSLGLGADKTVTARFWPWI